MNLPEYLRGLSFIKQRVPDLPVQNYTLAVDRFIALWLNSIVAYNIPLKRNIQIYKLLVQTGPTDVRKRILKKLRHQRFRIIRIIFKVAVGW